MKIPELCERSGLTIDWIYDFVRESIRLGILWLIIAIVIDAPLMLIGGPMKMTLAQYMADIGVTYLCIPFVTWGIGVAHSWNSGHS